jgi:hypothetical protein
VDKALRFFDSARGAGAASGTDLVEWRRSLVRTSLDDPLREGKSLLARFVGVELSTPELFCACALADGDPEIFTSLGRVYAMSVSTCNCIGGIVSGAGGSYGYLACLAYCTIALFDVVPVSKVLILLIVVLRLDTMLSGS